ncbi:MAG: hypothetical protein HN802_02670 [Candidatus Jacksonbacteria bacterium]|jgi:hypothetical protein|nr:hypothetical protein [Candidatus Jacksonbacteria bacterium]
MNNIKITSITVGDFDGKGITSYKLNDDIVKIEEYMPTIYELYLDNGTVLRKFNVLEVIYEKEY